MDNCRTYGAAPYRVAVVHGGPGAAGEMAPVARELAREQGILEPLQTATTLEGQVEELRATLESHAAPPVVLIGFSWGAWLSYIVAALHPALVRKLVLVSSGPFEERYVARLAETRLKRLNETERAEWQAINKALSGPDVEDSNTLLARLAVLASKADRFDPIMGRATARPIDNASPPNSPARFHFREGGEVGCRLGNSNANASEVADADVVNPQGDIFHGVWKTAAEWRRSGKLLELGKQIRCPVVEIHGDYDPHPAEGVEKPLSGVLKDFRFVLLRNCGHTPWLERQARDRFFAAIRRELA